MIPDAKFLGTIETIVPLLTREQRAHILGYIETMLAGVGLRSEAIDRMHGFQMAWDESAKENARG
jgi:hypothetical protein